MHERDSGSAEREEGGVAVSRLYDILCPLTNPKLEEMPVIKCENVFDHILSYTPATDSEHCWDLEKEIPCALPPFPICFIESSRRYGDIEKWGAVVNLINGSQINSVYPQVALAEFYFYNSGLTGIGHLDSILRWDMNELGKIQESSWFQKLPFDKTAEQELSSLVVTIWMTFAFMHCKNVTLTEHNPKDIKFKKPIRDSHGHLKKRISQTKYYTLDIEPMKRILKSEGNIDEVGIQRALHICRGHFKDYSKGKGLFGKYKGLYWWGSTVRGSEEAGRIEKDYNIKL